MKRIPFCMILTLVLPLFLISNVSAQDKFGWPNHSKQDTRSNEVSPVKNESKNPLSRVIKIPSSQDDSANARATVQVAHTTQVCPNCQSSCGGSCMGVKFYQGVDQYSCKGIHKEALWKDAHTIPWEAFAYGEYIGPYRTPHVPEYRVRVNDQIEFVYQLTREQTSEPYRLGVGDQIEITSVTDPDLNQTDVTVLSDGSISLRLIGRVIAGKKTIVDLQTELNERYGEYFKTEPKIVVRGTKTDTALEDLRDAVDARFGTGGQGRLAVVSPDGTIQLPMLGTVPAIGLSLTELEREINMRYRALISGIEVTPVLSQRAPRFIYVLGEVETPGRVELTGPTSAMQAIALAGGWNIGGNLRQIVVFRRDYDWRLMALRLDLAGALQGQRPYPSDEIWLRDSDIVLVPKKPIQRVADIINLYFTQGFYGIFPPELAFGRTTGIFD